MAAAPVVPRQTLSLISFYRAEVKLFHRLVFFGVEEEKSTEVVAICSSLVPDHLMHNTLRLGPDEALHFSDAMQEIYRLSDDNLELESVILFKSLYLCDFDWFPGLRHISNWTRTRHGLQVIKVDVVKQIKNVVAVAVNLNQSPVGSVVEAEVGRVRKYKHRYLFQFTAAQIVYWPLEKISIPGDREALEEAIEASFPGDVLEGRVISALRQVLGGLFPGFIRLHVDAIYKTQRADFPLLLTAQVVTQYRIRVGRILLNGANIFVKEIREDDACDMFISHAPGIAVSFLDVFDYLIGIVGCECLKLLKYKATLCLFHAVMDSNAVDHFLHDREITELIIEGHICQATRAIM